MKITLENIGALKNASVEIDSISIIAGYNDTGKSTVGKILEAIFDSVYIDEIKINEYKEKRFQQINRMIISEIERNILSKQDNDIFSTSETFRKNFESYLNSEQVNSNQPLLHMNNYTGLHIDNFKEYGKNFILNLLRKANYENIGLVANTLNDIINELTTATNKEQQLLFGPSDMSILTILLNSLHELKEQDSNAIFKDLLSNKLFKFGDLLSNKFLPDTKTSTIKLDFNNNTFLDLSIKYFEINMTSNFNNLGLAENIIFTTLTGDDKFDNYKKDSDDISPKTREVIAKISQIINGKFHVINGKVFFEKSNQLFDLSVSASGIKSFGLIYRMLLSGKLSDSKTLLIIDEPELHMHPEWQIKMAEILIIISKELYVPILVTTHSDLMLKAIVDYHKCYDLNKVHYYHAKTCADNTYISEIIEKAENDLYDIFGSFANPYFKLDRLNRSQK